MPIALRTNDSTMMMRRKLVTMMRMEGASASSATKSSASSRPKERPASPEPRSTVKIGSA